MGPKDYEKVMIESKILHAAVTAMVFKSRQVNVQQYYGTVNRSENEILTVQHDLLMH